VQQKYLLRYLVGLPVPDTIPAGGFAVMKKIFRISIIALLTLMAGLFLFGLALHEKEPSGIPSPEAEQLTQQIYNNIHKTAWDSTRWVKWTFRGDHTYLWDKFQNRVQVRWDDHEVILDLATQTGPAKKAGVLLAGEAAQKAAQKAYALFCNDGFWLMAPYKLTDPGTQRSIVQLADGRKGLKVSYDNGGVTPGDSYVWITDQNGMPTSFKMWVSVLPVGGLEATWEKWITLPTGARLSTYHLLGGKVESIITDVDGGMGASGI
jgi:hypothetical protein